jgi:hypothetical protein
MKKCTRDLLLINENALWSLFIATTCTTEHFSDLQLLFTCKQGGCILRLVLVKLPSPGIGTSTTRKFYSGMTQLPTFENKRTRVLAGYQVKDESAGSVFMKIFIKIANPHHGARGVGSYSGGHSSEL